MDGNGRFLVGVVLIASCLCLTRSQNVTCDSVSSDVTNVFSTYSVSVSGSDEYTLTYDPVEYGPGNRMPLGTSQVTATATNTSSPMNVIGSCVFNVTVSLENFPIACPVPAKITVETDPGQSTHTYQFQPINVTYQPESVTYESYGQIDMYLTFDGDAMNRDPALTVGMHTARIYLSDGNLTADCAFATIDVEDREPPVIICPDDIFATTPGAINFLPKNITDNADPNPTVTVVPFFGTPFELGVTLVTFIADDTSGNEANCTFTVTIDNSTVSTTEDSSIKESTTTEDPDMTPVPQTGSDNLVLIIACSVAGAVVLLVIVVILACCCSTPGRRSIFGIGPKEPHRHAGASRHGVATDPVLLHDKLSRKSSKLYGTHIFGPPTAAYDGVEMTETNEMSDNPVYHSADGETPQHERQAADGMDGPVYGVPNKGEKKSEL